ncbi:uncharacterized protein LOC144139038 [Haemaphysalis longicornis]
MAPTWVDSPTPTIGPYAPTMLESMNCIEDMTGIISGPVALSVSMKGRWYRPVDKVILAHYFLHANCKLSDNPVFPDASPIKICNASNDFQKNLDVKHKEVGKTYDNALRYAFLFDTSGTLQAKICKTQRLVKHVRFTVAIYDVNYDSGSSNCPDKIPGSYARLSTMKNLNVFLSQSDPNTADFYSRCQNFTA